MEVFIAELILSDPDFDGGDEVKVRNADCRWKDYLGCKERPLGGNRQWMRYIARSGSSRMPLKIVWALKTVCL